MTAPELVTRQVLLCHRVLRTIQAAATGSNSLTRETWSHLLKFLLAINDSLLGPPVVKGKVLLRYSHLQGDCNSCRRSLPICRFPPLTECCSGRHNIMKIFHRDTCTSGEKIYRIIKSPLLIRFHQYCKSACDKCNTLGIV